MLSRNLVPAMVRTLSPANAVHSVKPGRGGSWVCDRTCVNNSTMICEHILAVAQTTGKLQEFLSWFNRRKGPSMMAMVEQSGPKSAGRKPSGRKRSNAKQRPVTEHVDLLAFNRVSASTNKLHTSPILPSNTAMQSPIPAPFHHVSLPHSSMAVPSQSNITLPGQLPSMLSSAMWPCQQQALPQAQKSLFS